MAPAPQGKMSAKNQVLTRGGDSIAFSVRKSKNIAEIDYYVDYKLVGETVVCDISEADDRYDEAIKNGYKVAF